MEPIKTPGHEAYRVFPILPISDLSRFASPNFANIGPVPLCLSPALPLPLCLSRFASPALPLVGFRVMVQ